MPKLHGLSLVLLAACTSHLPMPMTAGQLAGNSDGDALVTYLGQRDASPAVCDVNASGPHLVSANGDTRDALVDGFGEQRIAPAIWRDCVDRLARSTDSESAASLFDGVARAYAVALADKRAEYTPIVQERLSVMHGLLLERPTGVAPHSDVMKDLVALLRDEQQRHRLGPVAMRFAGEMIASLELETGVRDGHPVDVALLDQLFAVRDESTLRRAALRLPDAQLREHARRLVVRLHIQTSPYAEVRKDAAVIEETMMRLGANPVAIASHRPLRAWVDTGAIAGRGVRVRQDLRRHTNTLLAAAGDGSISVLPQPSLHGALYVELDGVDRPVTVCALPEELDPSPCLAATDVALENPLAHVEADGSIRFFDQISARAAANLASSERLVVPVSVAESVLAELAWNLEFETPGDLVLESQSTGGDGPDVRVHVEPMKSDRLAYSITNGTESYHAIVEPSGASHFHVTSAGADGASGSDGLAGADGGAGSAGAGASCPSLAGSDGGRGGDGGAGGDGDAGGPGGRGGNVAVDVTLGREAAEALLTTLQGTIRSQGGDGGRGGSGGAGGRGGSGGSGGSGTTCVDAAGQVTTLSGGSSGLAGTDGRKGFDGSRGANGDAGNVTVRAIEPSERP